MGIRKGRRRKGKKVGDVFKASCHTGNTNKKKIYFLIYFIFEACAHNLRLATPESTSAQASNAARVRSHEAPDFQLF